MGNLFGGGGQSSTTNSTDFFNKNYSGSSSTAGSQTPDPLAGLAYQQVLQNASQIANTPFQPYQGQMNAGFVPDQLAAMQGYRDVQGMTQPYLNQAGDWTKQAVGFADPSRFNMQSLQQYMNPYQQSVVDATLANMKQNQDEMFNKNTSNAIRQGSFGGSGQFMGQAEIARQQGLSNAQTLAGLNAQNYNQAMGQYNQQQQQAIDSFMKGAGQYAGLGTTALQSRLNELSPLYQSGAGQQALAQKQLDTAYNQWQQARAYPYQQTSYFANLAQGIGPQMGQYTTSAANQQGTESGTNIGNKQTQTSGGGGGIMGAITSGIGLLSSLASGGVVKDRVNRATGGYMEHVGDKPYGEGPIDMTAGFGRLMQTTPFADAPDNYIGEAEKTSNVLKSAKEVGSEKLKAAVDKALGLTPKKSTMSFGNMGGDSGGESGSQESSGSLNKLVKSASKLGHKLSSDSDFGLGSMFGAGAYESTPASGGFDFGSIGDAFSGLFNEGGRVGRADGGSFAEQALASQKVQSDAKEILDNYKNILGRTAEQGGFDFWSQVAANGLNPQEQQAYFRDSPEFKKTKGQPQIPEPVNQDANKIGGYGDLLARAYQLNPGPQLSPEQQGMPAMPSPEYYNPVTYSTYPGSGGGNLNIAGSMNLSNLSPTSQSEQFVKSVYRNYLGRDPSPEEITARTEEISSGKSPSEIESGVIASPEAKNTAYIQSMYQDVLGRPAEEAGLNFWKGQLNEGLPAPRLSEWFKSAPEYKSTPAIFRSNAPVQGYFSSLGDMQFNPHTGLFNLKYSAPYRGSTPTYNLGSGIAASDKLRGVVTDKLTSQLPKTSASGGRIGKAGGGGLSGKSLYDYLISQGANEKEATMLTGMAKAESNFNPSVMHDNNTGYGLWGHGKDRWADMRKFTGQTKPGWEDQAKFALWELRNSSKTAMARQALARADDARGITAAGMHFERPRGYKAATPWTGDNWGGRLSNVSALMGGKDLGSGPEIRMAGNEPSSGALSLTSGTPAPRRNLLSRIIRELAPVSTAEAAESQPAAESKPMFEWPKLRNFKTNDLPTALGMNQPELPAWKKEVQTGFGTLGEDRPADQAQLLAEPSKHTAMGPEMEVPVPPKRSEAFPVVAEDREQGKKYYGDWRDQEPWKSDPIGGFFDALSGEEKKEDEPSKYEQNSGFGDLFNFAKGGTVRKHYAIGGGEDEGLGNPLEELGSMVEQGFGGLFGGGDESPAPASSAPESGGGLGDLLGGLFGGDDEKPSGVVASDREPSPSTSATSGETPQRGFLPPAVSQALIAAGMGMMASPNSNPLAAFGQGGLQGFQVYKQLADQQRKRDEMAAYDKRLSGAPVAGDREEDGEQPSGSKIDMLLGEMDRISSIPATTPEQIQQKNTALRNLQSRISITERIEQHRQEKSGKVGIIGKNVFGDPEYGWVSGPKAGQPITKAEAATEGVEASDKVPSAEAPKGDDVLSTLPPEKQDYIKGIASGEIEPPKGAVGVKIRSIVRQYDQNWNDDVWRQRRDMRKAYEPEGKIGQQMNTASTALGHAESLLEAHKDLHNWGFKPLNVVQNVVKDTAGSGAIDAFRINRGALINEMEKYFKGGTPAEAAIKRELESINENTTPEQISSTINKVAEMIQTKTKGYTRDWDRAFKGSGVSPINMDPHDLETNDKIVNNIRAEYERFHPSKKTKAEEKQVGSEEKPTGGKTIVRTGMLNGRKVVKYSDGTTAYVD
jgi:hypothetical protein